MEKILVICAHPDDEVLGCGGTLLKHKKKGDQINILFVFEGSSARYKNKNDNKIKKDIYKRRKSAIRVARKLKAKSVNFLDNENLNSSSNLKLEITKSIHAFIKKIDPNIIYTHSNKDLNIDHKTCLESVLVATRPQQNLKIKKILSFEIPSSTEWAFNVYGKFKGSYFVNISEFINEKIKLLNLYDYELKPYPYPRSNKCIISQSILAGSACGFKNAESFEVIRIFD